MIETAGQYLTTQGYGFGIELSDTSLYYDLRPKGLHFWSTSEKVPQVMWKDFVHSKLLQGRVPIEGKFANSLYVN